MRQYTFLAIMALGAAGAAQAETLTWHVRSQYPMALNFEVYSDNRNHSWPGGGKVWTLRNWEKQTITINCMRFEKVCYGAWSFTGYGSEYKYWGQGPSRQHSCSDCCYTCDGGQTSEIVFGNGGGQEMEGE